MDLKTETGLVLHLSEPAEVLRDKKKRHCTHLSSRHVNVYCDFLDMTLHYKTSEKTRWIYDIEGAANP